MSRRDTIIVAVLINTGLLAVLFMMAIHTDLTSPRSAYSSENAVAEVERPVLRPDPNPVKVQSRAFPVDDIDQMLQDYTPPTVMAQQTRPQENPQTLTLPATRDLLEEDSQRFVEVTVKRGDFLEKIAKANGTTVSAIMKANQMSTPRIDVGQILKIPVTGNPPKVVQPKPEIAAVDSQYYTLKSGDNPWKVAKQFHVGFGELLKMNQLDEEKARNLKPGDVLRVK